MKKTVAWPTALELLRANDYNPDDILAETADEFGYDTFSYDDQGNKLFEADGKLITVHHEWHSEQFGLDIMDAIWKDEGLS